MTVKDLNQEINEMLSSPMFWILLIILIITILLMLSIFLYELFSKRIHRSYHKGYNKAKSDKIQYYSTIRTLTDNFDTLIDHFTSDALKPSIITSDLIFKYRESLEKYYKD